MSHRIWFIALSALYFAAAVLNQTVAQQFLKAGPVLVLILMLNSRTDGVRMLRIGLIFSLMGDVLLLFQPQLFIPGLIAFLIAHVCYIWAFIQRDRTENLIGYVPFLVIGLIYFNIISDNLGAMYAPVLIYVIVITGMMWRAWRQRDWQSGRGRIAFFGSLLFAVSDGILAWNLFVEPIPFGTLWIMMTYWGAQLLIFESAITPSTEASRTAP